jgi:hypothetical protein
MLDEALVLAQQQLCREAVPADRTALIPKLGMRARLMGLALYQDGGRLACKLSPSPGGVSSAHINQLLTITGTVCKAGPVKALEVWRLYECTRCKHRCCVLGQVCNFTLWYGCVWPGFVVHLPGWLCFTVGLPCQRMWRWVGRHGRPPLVHPNGRRHVKALLLGSCVSVCV